MKDVIKFLCFIIYSTSIFFLPNSSFIFIFILINFIIGCISKVSIIKTINNTLKILPFIIFTFLINCVLDEYLNAFWIAIKMLIVCNITVIYSNTTTIIRNRRNNKAIMYAFKIV